MLGKNTRGNVVLKLSTNTSDNGEGEEVRENLGEVSLKVRMVKLA